MPVIYHTCTAHTKNTFHSNVFSVTTTTTYKKYTLRWMPSAQEIIIKKKTFGNQKISKIIKNLEILKILENHQNLEILEESPKISKNLKVSMFLKFSFFSSIFEKKSFVFRFCNLLNIFRFWKKKKTILNKKNIFDFQKFQNIRF